jgi:FKBP-type peptidyl-prolyl cis-trans isomerase
VFQSNQSEINMIKQTLAVGALAILQLSGIPATRAADADASKEAANSDPVGYFMGLSVGQQMKQNGFAPSDFQLGSLTAGFEDGMNGRESALTDDQLRETQQKIQQMLLSRRKEKGSTFLAENAKKPGVKVLEGGVQYKVLSAGQGKSPSATDTVKVHYTGRLIDGKVFDSSVQRGEPAEFPVNRVIRGWQIGIPAMKVGDKWELYIPSDLAYGERGSPPAIGPDEVLIFEVELLDIVK